MSHMKRRARAPRDQITPVRFSVDELAEIDRMAGNERMDRSTYIRAATFSYLALRGSKLAWRLLGEGLADQLREGARRTAAL